MPRVKRQCVSAVWSHRIGLRKGEGAEALLQGAKKWNSSTPGRMLCKRDMELE